MKDVDFFAPGARLALELECLLLEMRDTAAVSKWWDSAHEALEQWRQAVRDMEAADAAPQQSADVDAAREAASAVQGEPVAYIRQEDFEFILADDKSEPYGTRRAPVFSRNYCRAPVPLYASPRPPAQDLSLKEPTMQTDLVRGRQGEQTMNVQLVDELREVADWFRLRGLDENAALLDHAAHTVQCAANFFAWYNKYYPEPSSHPRHPWCVLGASLIPDKTDSARAALEQEAGND